MRAMEVPGGIRARYAYPWDKGLASLVQLPHARPVRLSFDVLDEKQKPVMNVTYERGKKDWLAIVEPLTHYPFPESDDFFDFPYELGCLLAKSIRQESSL
ncbi:MAG TPA: hypothetical protein VFE33_02835 [Thermoanaerobaculia bacterium]|nr:hypothetical protein [Thermoanaerobaculia bacterium]